MRLTATMLAGPLAESWKVVAQYFGPDDWVFDNRIESKSDRVHFYLLEATGLISSEEMYELLPPGNDGKSGREWRVFQWVMNR